MKESDQENIKNEYYQNFLNPMEIRTAELSENYNIAQELSDDVVAPLALILTAQKLNTTIQTLQQKAYYKVISTQDSQDIRSELSQLLDYSLATNKPSYALVCDGKHWVLAGFLPNKNGKILPFRMDSKQPTQFELDQKLSNLSQKEKAQLANIQDKALAQNELTEATKNKDKVLDPIELKTEILQQSYNNCGIAVATNLAAVNHMFNAFSNANDKINLTEFLNENINKYVNYNKNNAEEEGLRIFQEASEILKNKTEINNILAINFPEKSEEELVNIRLKYKRIVNQNKLLKLDTKKSVYNLTNKLNESEVTSIGLMLTAATLGTSINDLQTEKHFCYYSIDCSKKNKNKDDIQNQFNEMLKYTTENRKPSYAMMYDGKNWALTGFIPEKDGKILPFKMGTAGIEQTYIKKSLKQKDLESEIHFINPKSQLLLNNSGMAAAHNLAAMTKMFQDWDQKSSTFREFAEQKSKNYIKYKILSAKSAGQKALTLANTLWKDNNFSKAIVSQQYKEAVEHLKIPITTTITEQVLIKCIQNQKFSPAELRGIETLQKTDFEAILKSIAQDTLNTESQKFYEIIKSKLEQNKDGWDKFVNWLKSIFIAKEKFAYKAVTHVAKQHNKRSNPHNTRGF